MASLWPGCDGPGIRYISAPPSLRWQRTRRRSLVLLGATGSIGRSALSVVERNPDLFTIRGLACARNVSRLAEQADQFRPDWLAVLDEEAREALQGLLPAGYSPTILTGPEGYRALASLESADTVLSAQAGSAGLAGTLAAALAGKVICLANKESLVLAGELLRHVCSRTGASILPVDSEHFALFDCLSGRGDDAEALILTASGGDLRHTTDELLETVTAAQALKHTNWNMGAKITIDSATLRPVSSTDSGLTGCTFLSTRSPSCTLWSSSGTAASWPSWPCPTCACPLPTACSGPGWSAGTWSRSPLRRPAH